MKKGIIYLIFFHLLTINIVAQQSILDHVEYIQSDKSFGEITITGSPLNTNKKFLIEYRKGTNNIVEIKLLNTVLDTQKINFDEVSFEKNDIIKSIQVIQETPKEAEQFSVKVSIIGNVPIRATVARQIKNTLVLSLNKIKTKNVFPNDISGKITDELIDNDNANKIEIQKGIKFNPDGSPFDPTLEKRIDEKILKVDPTALFTKIINAGNKFEKATELGIFLNDLKKYQINQKLGVQFQVILITAEELEYTTTTIYFRDNFLKHAMFLADIIPGNQKIKRMIEQNKKVGTHIEIYIGKDFK